MPFDVKVDVEDSKGWHVWTVKRRHLARALFCCPVPADNLVVKIDDDFGDLERTSNHQGSQKIVNCITSKLTDWNLAASDYNSLVQIFKHKAQRACRISHGVSAVDDHKSIVVPIVSLNNLGHVNLVLQVHAARINQIFKLVHFKADTTVERTHRSDQCLFVTFFTFADLPIVERLVCLESICEA